MKFLRNLWDKIDRALDEFIANLIGEYDAEELEIDPQQVAGMVDIDSYETW